MQDKKAIDNLKRLQAVAETSGASLMGDGEFSSWQGQVRSVIARSLGEDHHLLAEFEQISFSGGVVYKRGKPSTPAAVIFLKGLNQACGVIDAAIFELEDRGDDAPIDDGSGFDPDLWAHVKDHIESENWQAVASQTAIFVEHTVRQWCGDPKDKDGKSLVGKGLFLRVLADKGDYRLGKEIGEWEGWRDLGIGFALALGNVDRHNIQDREDAKQYAFGVLGLGSLLLTQLRHQHQLPKKVRRRPPTIGIREWTEEEKVQRATEMREARELSGMEELPQ